MIRQYAAGRRVRRGGPSRKEGLLTPVLRDADKLSLGQAFIAKATKKELVGEGPRPQARPVRGRRNDVTMSNLGMFGIAEFTAMINPPSLILAIGAIRDVPVVKDGAVVPGQRMTLTLSCDHRVVDGAPGAAFLGDVKALLEEPMRMLL